MIRVLLILAGLLHASAAAAADGVVLRTSMLPDQAWVGQRTLLRIEVLAVDGWAQISRFADFEIPGAYVVRTETQGTRLNETINGVSHTGQRYNLSVYGQVAGRIEVPSIPVTVTVKTWGASGGDAVHEMQTLPVTFECRTPPGAEGVRGLVSSERVTADQTWSSYPDTLDPGDAITRTVVLRAQNASGMAFPPARHPAIEGVSIYPGPPAVEDTSDRGALTGKRVESVTYLFEEPGSYSLPTVRLRWWNLAQSRLETIELTGTSVVVREVDDLAPLEAAAEPGPDWRRRTLAAVGVIVLGLILWFVGRRVREWRTAYLQSEHHFFSLAMRSLPSGDARRTVAALMRWLDKADAGHRPARMDRFLAEHGTDAGRAAWNEFNRCLATGERFTAVGPLRTGLEHARRNLNRSRMVQESASRVLPPLNG